MLLLFFLPWRARSLCGLGAEAIKRALHQLVVVTVAGLGPFNEVTARVPAGALQQLNRRLPFPLPLPEQRLYSVALEPHRH
jgi:hypothetical protein